MKLSQFKFNLPSELIALQPTQNRDEARLMVVDRRTGKIEHRIFKDLVDYTKDGSRQALRREGKDRRQDRSAAAP